MPTHRTRRVLRLLLPALLAAGLLAACRDVAPSNDAAAFPPGTVPPQVQQIMDQSLYAHSAWGLSVQDDTTGKQLIDLNSQQLFPPGSTTKLFTGIPTWDTLGANHRFVTPVYATGAVTGGVLSSPLVLVAQGDLVMGGRAKPDGGVDFTAFDHMEANGFPGKAILTPEDPLAGIDALAAQVAASGVTQVTGDVVVDDRLWTTPQQLSSIPLDPMMINENVIDLTVSGTTPGAKASFSYRPQVSDTTVNSEVTVGQAGSAINLTIDYSADGHTVTIKGTVPPDGKPVVQVAQVSDPASFGRAALIDALRRHGVTVTASTSESNPTGLLPAENGYSGDARVAAYTSPPFREYEKLILKVSHNLGADTNMCLLAVANGSKDCAAALPIVRSFLLSHGVNGGSFSFADGRGGEPADLTTPAAALQLLAYIRSRPDAGVFIHCLPILGVDGTIGFDLKNSPAAGHVFGKTGTVAAGDVAGQRLALIAETLVGYIDAKSGRKLRFSLYVNNALLPSFNDLFGVFSDLDKISAALWYRY